MKCPRCASPLESGKFHGAGVHKCTGCDGVLVSQRTLIPLMEALTKALSEHVDLNQPVPPIPDLPGKVVCPTCGDPMTNFGYMGTNRVFLDRCSGCMLLWIDGEEVITLAMVYARTKKRGDERRAFYAERAKQLEDTAHRIIMTRAMMNRGFSMGGF